MSAVIDMIEHGYQGGIVTCLFSGISGRGNTLEIRLRILQLMGDVFVDEKDSSDATFHPFILRHQECDAVKKYGINRRFKAVPRVVL